MTSVLVCHSYFLAFDDKQRKRAKPYPPLATIQVAALLRNTQHHVALFDAMLADGIDDYRASLKAFNPDIVLFYEDNYNYLSKMCLGRMRAACCTMIALAKARGARVIAAGSDASDVPTAYIDAGADAVLIGEGLATLTAVMDRHRADPRIDVASLISGLPDIAARVDGRLIRSQAAAPLPQPALVQQPAWDLVDLDSYRRIWREAHGYFSLNMAASRGCSFRCNWCAKPIWGNRYLQRSPSDVGDELLHLKLEYGADHVWFADDIFGFKADWVADFADVLAAGGGGLPFKIQLRADLINPGMTEALARAGCSEVWIGAESGSQKILDAMNKGTTIDAIVRSRRMLGDRGIRVGFFLMLGYSGEQLSDLIATRDLVSKAAPDDVGVSVAYPLPGTKFYDQVQKQLAAKRNWQESNDLEMMFDGTYQSTFYHQIRDLLHEQVDNGWSADLQQRWDELLRREAQYKQTPDRYAANTVHSVSVNY